MPGAWIDQPSAVSPPLALASLLHPSLLLFLSFFLLLLYFSPFYNTFGIFWCSFSCFVCGVVRWVRSAREVLESQPSEGKPTPKTQAVPSLPASGMANGKAPHHSNHRDSASSRRRARFLPRPRESSYSSSRRDRWRDLRRGLHIPFNNTESRSESGYTVWCLDCFRVVLGVFLRALSSPREANIYFDKESSSAV